MNMKYNSKIMITGAYGLVGSAIVRLLEKMGFENLQPVGRKECDLTDKKQVEELFENNQPEYVFHCAAKVYGILGNMNNKALSFYDNVMINTNIIHSCKLVGVKKILAMGTGAVYPFPSPGLPLKEDMIFMGRPHSAENSYAQAKRAMLAMLEAYNESHQMEWAYIVSCNLFGPNDKFDTTNGHVVPSLIKKFFDAKKTNSKVSVWGDGSAKRDFLFVDDAALSAITVMNEISGSVNIGSGEVLSIRDIVSYLEKITDMQGQVEWDSSKPNGQDYRAYDLSKLNQTSFKKRYSIEQGLHITWDWYKSRN